MGNGNAPRYWGLRIHGDKQATAEEVSRSMELLAASWGPMRRLSIISRAFKSSPTRRVRAVIAGICLAWSTPGHPAFADFPAIVTQENLRRVVLGDSAGLSSAELRDLDINGDDQVDVADLVAFLRTLPALPAGANFLTSQSEAVEGNAAITIPVAVSPGYSGILAYVIEGTAVAGSDFVSNSNTLLIVDGRADLIINLLDDRALEDVKTLKITLLPSAGYEIGPSQQHVVYLADNDVSWEGRLDVRGLSLPFTMNLLVDDGDVFGQIKGDGGMGIPEGTFDVEVIASPTRFMATLGPFAVERSDTLLNASLSRTIALSANSNSDQEEVDYGKLIAGSFTETVTSESGAKHLELSGGSAIEGTFILLQGAPFVPASPSGLVMP